jgi:hypothetical protein
MSAVIDERRPQKTQLPFKFVPSDLPLSRPILKYYGEAAGRVVNGEPVLTTVEYSLVVNASELDCNPLGFRVRQLMVMYEELEASVLPIQKERDELLGHKSKLEGELKDERSRVAELRARVERMGKK